MRQMVAHVSCAIIWRNCRRLEGPGSGNERGAGGLGGEGGRHVGGGGRPHSARSLSRWPPPAPPQGQSTRRIHDSVRVRVAEVIGTPDSERDEIEGPQVSTRVADRIATGSGADRQITLGAFAEQLICEANAVLDA